MSAVAEKLIEAHTVKRHRLLAEAERVDARLVRHQQALADARRERDAAAATAQRFCATPHITETLARLEASVRVAEHNVHYLLRRQGELSAELQALDSFVEERPQ